MSLKSRIAAAIYKPVRGIGRIVRGDVRAGLRDIGQGAQAAGPALAFIPGVNAVGMGAMMAGAGALGTKKGAGLADSLKAGVVGGVKGYAMGQAAGAVKGLAGRMAGAVRGAPSVAADAAGAVPVNTTMYSAGTGGMPIASAPGAVPTTSLANGMSVIRDVKPLVPSIASDVTSGVAPSAGGGLGSRIAAAGGGMLNWAEKNPALASQVVGGVADVYGAQQMGAAQDEQLAFIRERERREREARSRAWARIRARQTAAGY